MDDAQGTSRFLRRAADLDTAVAQGQAIERNRMRRIRRAATAILFATATTACAVTGGDTLPYDEWEAGARTRINSPSDAREWLNAYAPMTCYKAAWMAYSAVFDTDEPERIEAVRNFDQRAVETRNWC
jgi:hypothetical protein